MIKSFRTRETKKIFERQQSHKLPTKVQKIALRKLWMIDAATSIRDLVVPPANRLERLKGKRKGQYSIRVNKQWRTCFYWSNGHAYQVEIVDYHDEK